MDEQPGGPEKEPNHWLVVGLRIVLVSLVVLIGILAVGKYFVAKADLKEDPATAGAGGPVPVSPITPSASPSPQAVVTPDTTLPTLSEAPAPTYNPPEESMPAGLVLTITPATVASGQTFTVSGTYAGRDGVPLDLQVLQSGTWVNYANQITVSMGTFSTTASSTALGANSFRVYDESTTLASNVVTVVVR